MSKSVEELVLLSLTCVEKATNELVVKQYSTIDQARSLDERLAMRATYLDEAQVYATLANAMASDGKGRDEPAGKHRLNTHNRY